ncbi:MAG: hypothetical protein A3I75_03575 [Deltaproteobacteria bacterium RIFCSPLOWO2_02_FULL_50_16]|nr:MAG: hypothetical protein A2053_01945 [Deltaproteobacteria bacterium GWA2_50_8]OGQ29007.1 MAG: hypothetical protein A3B79_04540 [Deltaproteobacteria bacterium RIFCSPHIGHO2_02_FULL_50_15]OGQ55624.1 MAG: hypothetical protein A3I75_03575 [Deltaproteobacteria bacterium RIFCSPLOWO2_02_FULL_50_16]OGQ68390.1 MAG: hypothetical protein A3F89_07610 [Deltaproteobacteria bacterium RIFCSPLOWO2_12_FULL_50_11]
MKKMMFKGVLLVGGLIIVLWPTLKSSLLSAENPGPEASKAPWVLDCTEAESRLKASPEGQVVWRAIEVHGGFKAWIQKKDLQYREDIVYHKTDAEYEQENIVKVILGKSPNVLIKKMAPLKDVVLGLKGRAAWRTDKDIPITHKDRLAEAQAELQETWDQIHWPFSLAAAGIKLEAMPPILSDKGLLIFHRIRVKQSDKEWKIFYFDARQGWLERIYFQTEKGSLAGRPFLEVFGKYQKTDKILIPMERSYFIPNAQGDVKGPAFMSRHLRELRFDNGLDPKHFENPQKVQVKMKTQS